ncbi:hypothetical protein JTB14_024148 [Gonioctena quinquepunctata]|nr:hypothetical protein JTB14_024148 [Gonioctena quinquepunctata]
MNLKCEFGVLNNFENIRENIEYPDIVLSLNYIITEWFPNTLQSTYAVMQYNIAVAKTIRGQLDQAAAMLKQIWQQKSSSCKVPTHIIMLFIYIELQLGHTDVAKNLIRQYHHQQRISG